MLRESIRTSSGRNRQIEAQLIKHFEAVFTYLETHSLVENEKEKLADLPWWLMLNFSNADPGALMGASGLHFLKSAGTHLKTHRLKEGHWWAAKEGLFFEVDAHYLIHQKNNRFYRSAWLALLKKLSLIRKKKSGLKGILILLDLSQLVDANPTSRHRYWQSIKGRLHELNQYSKQNFPCYLVITQTNRLRGFSAFFDELNDMEAEASLGLLFNSAQNQSESALFDAFDTQYDQFLLRLNQGLIQRLHHERHLAKRDLIKAFPLQMESLKKPLAALIAALAPRLGTKGGGLLRGLYFVGHSSAEVDSLDRLETVLKESFQLQPISSYQANTYVLRPYFIPGLFRQVCQDSLYSFEPVSDEKKTRKGLWLSAIILGLSVMGTAIAIEGKTLYQLHQTLVEITQILNHTEVNSNPSFQQSLTALMNLLRVSELSTQKTLPWLLVGLNPHDRFIFNQAQMAFTEAVRDTVAKKLVLNLRQELNEPLNRIQGTILYPELATYLMLGDPLHFNQDKIIKVVNHLLGSQLSLDDQAAFENCLKQGLEPSLTYPLDKAFIQQARSVFEKLSLAEKVNGLLAYQSLDQAPLYLALPRYQGKVIFNSSEEELVIPSWFTRDSFHQTYNKTLPNILPLLFGADWVSQANPHFQTVPDNALSQIQAYYLASYIQTWRSVLDNLALRPISDYGDLVFLSQQLTDPNSTWLQLIYTVMDNTTLPEEPGTALINQAFQASNQQTNPILAENRDNLLALNRLASELMKDNNGGDAALLFLKLHAQRESGQNDYITALNDQIREMPQPYASWFKSLVDGSIKLLLADASHAILQHWSELYQGYTEDIRTNYPFNLKATTELDPKAFVQFFGKQGTLSQFWQDNMALFALKTGQGEVTLIPYEGHSIPLAPEVLTLMKDLYQQQAFFLSQGSDSPAFSFLLKPLGLPHQIDEITLAINGKTTTFSNNFLVATQFEWPGSTDLQLVNLSMSTGGHEIHLANFKGFWSLFRFLGTLNPQWTNDHLLLNAQTPEGLVQFELIPLSGMGATLASLIS